MKRWMMAALIGLAAVSTAAAADARGGYAPRAEFHRAPVAHAREFGLARRPGFAHRDRAELRDGFPLLSGPMVSCGDYNPWISVPPYPMTCD